MMAEEPGERKAVVVSAMSGVTDALLGLVALAKKRATVPRQARRAAREARDHGADLLSPPEAERLRPVFESDTIDMPTSSGGLARKQRSDSRLVVAG